MSDGRCLFAILHVACSPHYALSLFMTLTPFDNTADVRMLLADLAIELENFETALEELKLALPLLSSVLKVDFLLSLPAHPHQNMIRQNQGAEQRYCQNKMSRRKPGCSASSPRALELHTHTYTH